MEGLELGVNGKKNDEIKNKTKTNQHNKTFSLGYN